MSILILLTCLVNCPVDTIQSQVKPDRWEISVAIGPVSYENRPKTIAECFDRGEKRKKHLIDERIIQTLDLITP